MSELKPYPEYKDSGVEWLGEIPALWDVQAIKSLATLAAGGTPDSGNDEYWASGQDGSPWIAIGDMSTLDVTMDTQRRVSEKGLEDTRLRVVSPPAVLFAMYASVGETAYLPGPAVWNQAILGLLPKASAHPRFLYWAMRSIRPVLPFFYRSNTQDNLNANQVANLQIAFPPRQEQVTISQYLDRETAEIDAFIADQEELIRLLTERRAATISHAVTKGLDPAVPMKDSGIEWVGDIPSQWIAGKIRRFAEMRTGHTPNRSTPEYWLECHIPWFTLADVWQLRKGHRYLGETKELISSEGLSNSAAELLPESTVVLSRTASVGFTGIMPRPMATSQDFWNWVCGTALEPTFLWYELQAMRPHFGSLVHGSTHKTIYKADAAALAIAVPPLSEQQEIVRYLDREVAEIDAAIADAREAIALSRERRVALISAAVTGKIDVREHS